MKMPLDANEIYSLISNSRNRELAKKIWGGRIVSIVDQIIEERVVELEEGIKNLKKNEEEVKKKLNRSPSHFLSVVYKIFGLYEKKKAKWQAELERINRETEELKKEIEKLKDGENNPQKISTFLKRLPKLLYDHRKHILLSKCEELVGYELGKQKMYWCDGIHRPIRDPAWDYSLRLYDYSISCCGYGVIVLRYVDHRGYNRGKRVFFEKYLVDLDREKCIVKEGSVDEIRRALKKIEDHATNNCFAFLDRIEEIQERYC